MQYQPLYNIASPGHALLLVVAESRADFLQSSLGFFWSLPVTSEKKREKRKEERKEKGKGEGRERGNLNSIKSMTISLLCLQETTVCPRSFFLTYEQLYFSICKKLGPNYFQQQFPIDICSSIVECCFNIPLFCSDCSSYCQCQLNRGIVSLVSFQCAI